MGFGKDKTATWRITADFDGQVPVNNKQLEVFVYHDDGWDAIEKYWLKLREKLTCTEMRERAIIVETVYFNKLYNDKNGSGL